jgi:hypothetical protein
MLFRVPFIAIGDAMSTALRHMTVDEFLLWAEGREGRWQLHDGTRS